MLLFLLLLLIFGDLNAELSLHRFMVVLLQSPASKSAQLLSQPQTLKLCSGTDAHKLLIVIWMQQSMVQEGPTSSLSSSGCSSSIGCCAGFAACTCRSSGVSQGAWLPQEGCGRHLLLIANLCTGRLLMKQGAM